MRRKNRARELYVRLKQVELWSVAIYININGGLNIMSKVIHQEISFKAGSQRIYEALTNADQFGELTNAPAEINSESGGKFSCFGGMITGQTIEVVPGTRLVQAWRVGHWEPGVYSIVKFELLVGFKEIKDFILLKVSSKFEWSE